ncbi:multiple sugar transport system ATP-binding protein [Spiroplasma sp. TIUS-1]|uniref:ATP-binding cassette domain-containing protein n=1 Tax=Spiroplasma sp. TIUS-1 TaxID=216963 RepID=UPI0013989AE1|nr:ATP-binding cassette domain-containing protein [Spiroplasma sp. TIUS-1]QHX35667.1 multiple sugar transport system ATP-binding protein [Spiroplasma sp. TIUS-1]
MSLTVKNLKIKYDNKNIVDNVSFSVQSGEVFTILGPSGSGKTTLLDSIAGLKQLSSGQILFDKFDVTRTAPQKRNVGYIFQDYALYPHLSVEKNISLPLFESKSLKNKIKTKNIKIKRKISILNKSNNIKDLFDYQISIYEQLEKQISNAHDAFFSDDENITKKLLEEVEAIAAAKISRNEETLYARITSVLFDQARILYFNEYVKTFEEVKNFVSTLEKQESDGMIRKILNSILRSFDYEWIVKYKYLSNKNKKSVKSQIDLFKHELNQIKVSKIEIESFKKIISPEYLNDMFSLLNNAFNIVITEVKTVMSNNFYTFVSDFQDCKKTLELSLEPKIYSKEELQSEKNKLKSEILNIKDITKTMVENVATKVEIQELLNKKPGQLSWGQQQRVAIARAIVKTPDVLLMDEALSHLDYQLKSSTTRWFKEFQRKMNITTIAVTHDQSEAMGMSDKIAILNKGKIIQIGTPSEIYNNPANKFVAEFVGSPKTNIFEAIITNSKIKIQNEEFKTNSDGEVYIGIRPEDIIFGNKFTGTISLVEYMGQTKNVSIKFENKTIIASFDASKEFSIGQEIKFDFKSNKLLIFEKGNDQKLIEVL